MAFTDLPHDRRRFLRLAAGFSTGALLAGCGGGGDGSDDAVAVVSAPVAVVPAAAPAAGTATAHPLALALTLAYLGAQYHGVAAHGTGLAAAITGGVGRAGGASGGRQVAFADPTIAALAAELAEEKTAQVVALRAAIGTAAAAQPALDLSPGAAGAFSVAAQRAGIVGDGQAFDPYAGDDAFLLGAFLIEYGVAATYRTPLLDGTDDPAAATHLATAIYHGGLIRALLDGRAAADPAVGAAFGRMTAMLAALDGTNVGDQTLAGGGASSNLLDADGRPIPFTRATAQVLNALYLSSAGAGGFLPMGANGVA